MRRAIFGALLLTGTVALGQTAASAQGLAAWNGQPVTAGPTQPLFIPQQLQALTKMPSRFFTQNPTHPGVFKAQTGLAAQGNLLAQNNRSDLSVFPLPRKGEGAIPIPTQWPHARLEAIPTRWPHMKMAPVSAAAAHSAPGQRLPGRQRK